MTDPNGNPGCFRDRVERLPMRPRYIRVRVRSANVGSGTGGWSVAGPGPACFLVGEEGIVAVSWGKSSRVLRTRFFFLYSPMERVVGGGSGRPADSEGFRQESRPN